MLVVASSSTDPKMDLSPSWFLSRIHLVSSFLSSSARSLNFSKEDLDDIVRLDLCHFTPLLYMAPKLNSWVEVILYVFFST